MITRREINANRIKLKYLSEKQNDYGCNHMFQLLDESPLKEPIELEDMKNYLGI